MTIAEKNEPTAASDTVDMHYGVYLEPGLPAGIYEGVTVNYAIVVNIVSSCPTPVPGATYMQDITSENRDEIPGSITEDSQYYMLDQRDNKRYCVAKHKGGNLWMTQNLDLDIDSNKTYTAADTDLLEGMAKANLYTRAI
jgi:hypothetical protein